MDGETKDGRLRLKVPNLVTQGLYVERIREMLLPAPVDRDEGVWAGEKIYQEGDIKPLIEFIEQKVFKIFSTRDYRWANELTIKTIFLTLLYNDILFIMDSEGERERRYTDLTMIIRPDMRRFEIFDILIEFKFISLKEAKLTGKAARALKPNELKALKYMKDNMKEAKEEAATYAKALNDKYKDLRLKTFAVVSLGFERLWAEEVVI